MSLMPTDGDKPDPPIKTKQARRWPVLGLSWRAALGGLFMAQILWLTVGLVLYCFDDWTDKLLLDDGRHDLVFSVLRSTAKDPAQSATLLRSLDDHFRVRDPLVEEESDLVTSLVVWHAGSLVYSPLHMALPPAPTPLGEIRALETARGAGGQLCKAEPQSSYVNRPGF